MNITFRWYGRENDTVTLEQIKQIPGTKGIVWALHDKPVGEVWSTEEIESEVNYIQSYGFHAEVVESVNVHESIKLGLPEREQLIENYKQTIRNLAKSGVKVICYNFMPIFDWIKTDLDYRLADGSSTMAFEKAGIDKDPEEIVKEVEESSSGYTLPGWEPERLAHVKELFAAYKDVDDDKLRENFAYFLKAIIPTCEEVGIKMAVHPDDPPYSIFGLPRIVKNRDDLDWVCNVVDSPSNGITLCTGSIAEDPANNVYEILAEFCRRDRIPFAHVRNIQYLGNDKDFYEAPHLSSEGSLDMYQILEAMYKNGFDGYIRPDHGRMIWGETGRPGYGLYDRAIGASYLLGLWEAIDKSVGR